ncbi:uncharacterized protein DUF4134 [Flavobacterium croceum DSM 17960]|uniref:Uncharacterized protein DUF4134 n=1 Tax=Flavobacterium croceum DSM 17960 TaxID=1121886 RepID=A0A2S4N5A3_9FLAO|nr:DUF4134 family protein [Flavobacterium croceum]POS00908.1 uncharacterized protein DUF4134 [Flavobacterium croceum DSM 17960]
MKKKLYVLVPLFCLAFNAFAQQPAQSNTLTTALQQATTQTSSLANSVKLFLYALAAIVALYGAFKVFTKHQNGDQDTSKAMGQWAFAFIFLVVAGYVIGGVFGVSLN